MTAEAELPNTGPLLPPHPNCDECGRRVQGAYAVMGERVYCPQCWTLEGPSGRDAFLEGGE